ncbi:hypothetical protein PZB75_09660 [Streptomyces sp. AM 4-1-1]|uniref:hypothetical protein n=1 Tax=Streptomyces sp. AM 4-1-1 TaxID=3028710 RepID=UPI0023B937F4|nr:hypothetical protein [Streptomyces sp. AM 4-1-1]WEH33615.1 hypothetical protein PZB75_09660 [Streptomyces sp. AM 4-1-1]
MTQEPNEPDEGLEPEETYLSGLINVMPPMTNLIWAQNAELMKRLTEIVMPTHRFVQAMTPSIVEFSRVITPIREVFASEHLQQQWRNLFISIGSLKDRIYPENLRDAEPRLKELKELLLEEGIPLMWVPGPKVVRALLDAQDAVERRRIIGRRWRGIVNDCETAAKSVDHPNLLEVRDFALDCVAALRAGHTNPAQALAANLLDSLMHSHFEKSDRVKLTSNKKSKAKFDLNDHDVRVALTFAPVWYAYAEYWTDKGDPVPRMFARHASAHGVSRTQYSRINAIYGLMLATSVMKFFDVELER